VARERSTDPGIVRAPFRWMPRNVEDAVFWSRGKEHVLRALDRDLEVDAVVVGGGLAGLTACSTLADLGLRVALLEQAYCGAGATGHSSGFLTPDSELQLKDLRAKLGDTRARCLWELADSGIDTIRMTAARYAIECDLEAQRSLFVAPRAAQVARVEAEHASRQSLSYPSELLRRDALGRVLGADFEAAVAYGGTWSMDPYRYARGLARALIDRGVQVYEGTRVTDVRRGRVVAGRHHVRAEHVLVCTDRFTPQIGLLERGVSQVQTFLAISEPLRPDVLARMFPDGPRLVWEAKLLYHYARLTGGDRLLVGGASLAHTYTSRPRHDPESTAQRLDRWVARHFAGADVVWAAAWPGLLGVTRDLLGLAGEIPDLPGVHCVVAATGLPWCAALGRAAAVSMVDGHDRVPAELAAARAREWHRPVIGKRASFALAHASEKLG
jgi:gamma-glutamylputrescine oxidase